MPPTPREIEPGASPDALQRLSAFALVVLDERGTVLRWNRTAEELFGLPVAATGRRVEELSLAGQGAWLPLLERARATGEAQLTTTLDLHGEDGCVQRVRFRVAPVASTYGKAGELQVQGEPLSDSDPSQEAEEMEELAAALRGIAAERTSEGVLHIAREHGRALLGADAAAVLLRGAGDTVLWYGAPEPLATEAGFPDLMDEVMRHSRSLAFSPPGSRGNGLLIALGGDPAPGALVLGWSDRTPRPRERWMAEMLAEHVGIALEWIERRSATCNAALRQERLLSLVGHDLRSPLTALAGYGELLLDGVAGPLAHRQREMLLRMQRLTGHLSAALRDTVEIARLDAGQVTLHPEPVSLFHLVRDAAAALEAEAERRGLTLALEVEGIRGEVLHADPVRLGRILSVLLGNAVGYTERGGVRVRAACGRESVWVIVEDSGRGIPAGQEETIFEELHPRAGTHGSGIGLAVARRLARTMGGELSARPRPEGGAAFTLHLPRGQST